MKDHFRLQKQRILNSIIQLPNYRFRSPLSNIEINSPITTYSLANVAIKII